MKSAAFDDAALDIVDGRDDDERILVVGSDDSFEFVHFEARDDAKEDVAFGFGETTFCAKFGNATAKLIQDGLANGIELRRKNHDTVIRFDTV